jgi:hypothetical protein
MASSLAAKKVEQKHLKVIIKEPYSYSKVLYPKYYKHLACTLAHQNEVCVQFNDKSWVKSWIIFLTLQLFWVKILDKLT